MSTEDMRAYLLQACISSMSVEALLQRCIITNVPGLRSN
ncbi:hypothetical protein ANAPC1_01199 [Anaplasma phagocytophilum]|uniref:Uncharacterized protein n=1 Tax=Anaplasma phagocytophilum TaxID=948 RepID=A0AA45UTX4_ANAPH|nr:hypothetical protein ANAPC1_01199 [Anaplasma phagocytophilum]